MDNGVYSIRPLQCYSKGKININKNIKCIYLVHFQNKYKCCMFRGYLPNQ